MILVALLRFTASSEPLDIELPVVVVAEPKSVAMLTRLAIYGTSGRRFADRYMIFLRRKRDLRLSSEASSVEMPTLINASYTPQ